MHLLQTLLLILLVRDLSAAPLPEIALEVWRSETPPTLAQVCVTDAAGRCALRLPAGPYLVRFVADPRQEDFALYLDPAQPEALVTFVLAAGRPAWDMSRDPAALPEPFSAAAQAAPTPVFSLLELPKAPDEPPAPPRPLEVAAEDEKLPLLILALLAGGLGLAFLLSLLDWRGAVQRQSKEDAHHG